MAYLNYGDTVHLQNMYSPTAGDYLDRNNAVEGQNYCVVTTASPTRDGMSGTWKIGSATSARGQVKVGDIIKLSSLSQNGGYLCANFYDASLCQVLAVTDREPSAESLQWEIVVPNGMKGDSVSESDVVYLKNCSQAAYLMVDGGAPAWASNAIYNVMAMKTLVNEGQQKWRFIVVSSNGDSDSGDGNNSDGNNSDGNNNNNNNNNNAGNGTFKLPPNTRFGVTVLTNTDTHHEVQVYVDDKEVAHVHQETAGDQTGDSVMGTTQQASGSGNVRITVTSNGKLTPIKSTQSSIDSNLNWGIVGAPDANGHYNDCVVFLNWPIK